MVVVCSFPFAFLTSTFILPIFFSACVSDFLSSFLPRSQIYPRVGLLIFWHCSVLVGLGQASEGSQFVFGNCAGSSAARRVVRCRWTAPVCFSLSFIVLQICFHLHSWHPLLFIQFSFLLVFLSSFPCFLPRSQICPPVGLLPFWCSLILVGPGGASERLRFVFGDCPR